MIASIRARGKGRATGPRRARGCRRGGRTVRSPASGSGVAVHPKVFAEFDRICRTRSAGGAVLEIGAVPSEESLLRLPSLAHATEKIGVSLDGPSRFADFEILAANANDLSRFEDGRFDTVLCNSVLEHDPRFWRRSRRSAGSRARARSWRSACPGTP